jgi:hypothetical protein
MKRNADPRRQLARYRHMVEAQRRTLRWATLLWLVPLVLLAIAYTFDGHWALKTFFWIALLSGVVQQLNELGRLRDYEQKQQITDDSSNAGS